jgi:hypothetical protein
MTRLQIRLFGPYFSIAAERNQQRPLFLFIADLFDFAAGPAVWSRERRMKLTEHVQKSTHLLKGIGYNLVRSLADKSSLTNHRESWWIGAELRTFYREISHESPADRR